VTRIAAEPHRGGGVDHEPQGTFRLRLELLDEQALVSQQGALVEPAQVVAGHVAAMARKLEARAATMARVQADPRPLGDATRRNP
jgi:hypothetical protein